MGILARALQRLLIALPAHNRALYDVCRRYVDNYNGDNNGDFATNGELRLMRQLFTSAETVFDVGSNVGQWSQLALAINPGLHLHCFEPSPATFKRLVLHGWPTNVVCNNFGLGSIAEIRDLHIFEDGSGMNSLHIRQGLETGWGIERQQRTETISIDTLDHYCEHRQVNFIDFLKVDVEGHEMEVLKGGHQMLSQGRIGCAQVEYGGTNIDSRALLKDLFEFVAPLPYRAHKIFPDGLRPVERYDQRLENFQYQNWALIKTP